MADLGLHPEDLGPSELLAEFGADHCGRYEWVFARLRELLHDYESQILDLMSLSDVREQSRRMNPQTELGCRIKQAFADVMGLSNLIAIFGSEATANRVMPFCEHFFMQTSVALGTLAAAQNPFLHSIFLGRFPGPSWPWLSLSPQPELCPLSFSCDAMEKILPSLPESGYDFVHLSNILDWISPERAATLLRHAHRCLSPGGIVVIRQLNSSLDIPRVPSGFQWMRDLAEQLHRNDRSFFYRALHVGKRR
jgi:S-adenosylmethionine-diacylglycerol 3-amino-3-carboxypropyl transferase